MRYMDSKLKAKKREEIYRIFVSEGIKLNAQGKYLTASYADYVEEKPKDTRTAEEIALEVIKKAGLTYEYGS